MLPSRRLQPIQTAALDRACLANHLRKPPAAGSNDPAGGQPPRGQPTEVLAGSIERVTFHSAESGFCVLRIKTYGHCGLIAMMGHAAIGSAGVWVTIDWH